MIITEKQLKNGVEVDLPMINGSYTEFAIRWNKSESRFEIYSFRDGGMMFASDSLERVVDRANKVFNTNDEVA
tara:strand:- start:170 stop:388 length:219 start_codon:yes stop_codon:yes gene_type:complete